ncbi:DUF883 family protein [Janthinobacterium sp. 17J80-10]|uniref:DUF883 family protein n=1 Tax=Janthinobacterium sp. 17J80-10 TaxID=2497863 RepID=UPI001005A527|nr:DUF883 family protein [Janthinobacterium sp. 17J80-10]QAU34047.1 DUF883 domain-containing protein [Janthinobacterium sp. 17J80-10]
MNPEYPSSSTTSSDLNSPYFGSNADDLSQPDYDESVSGKSGIKRAGASLRTELGNLKSDLDTLLGRATNLSDAELRQEYSRLMSKFSSLRAAAKGVATQAGQQLNRGMDATSGYVREKPLQSVAVATGVGMVLGMLLHRR